MQKKIFSLLVLLLTAATGAWAQTETPLVTIQASENSTFTSGSKTFNDIATVTITGDAYNGGSAWGNCTLTVTPADGVTITSVKFYGQANGKVVEDTSSPFEAEIIYDSDLSREVTKVNGTNAFSYGVTKIEVYGYASAPAATTNYYLVGTMNDWGASKQFLLTPNPGNAAEYMITLNLKADTQLKVIGVDAQNNATWYPSGDNYYVNTAGQYTVYFRPDGSGTGEGWHYGCIYLDPAPAPAVPLTDLGSGQWQFQMPSYAVVAKIEYDTELELQEENVNTAVLADWHGYEADITLQRTLQVGGYNTFAVPFNIDAIPSGWTVKELNNASFANGTLTLTFANALSIKAGKPYLVKVAANADLSAEAFAGVTVSKDAQPYTSTDVDFIPTLGKTTIEGSDTKAVLFLAANNKLLNPSALPANMKGFRAYFQLKGEATQAARFTLDFGNGETTSISEKEIVKSDEFATAPTYDLQGRKVNATQKGVYIVNGKKVIK